MIKISFATLNDLQRLMKLETQLFSSDRISHRQFKYLLTKANSFIVKAEDCEQLSGYMVLLKKKRSRKLRIYSLGVDNLSRKRGVASVLLNYAEHLAREHHFNQLTLEVGEKNDSAVSLYKRAGFYMYGRKTNYYEDGSTALLLRKKIFSPEPHNDSPRYGSTLHK